MDETLGMFQEFAKYPITTVISLLAVIIFLYWFIIERPKIRKEREDFGERERKERIEIQKQAHEDRVHLAEETAASREVLKLQQSVIENNTVAMNANIVASKALKESTERQVEYLKEFRACAHEEHSRLIELANENLQQGVKNEMLIKSVRADKN